MPAPVDATGARHRASPGSCPDCAAVLETDERFPVWCPGCEWNLEPAEPARESDPKKRRRAEREKRRTEAGKRRTQARAEGLFDALLNGDQAPAGRDSGAARTPAAPRRTCGPNSVHCPAA
ncbi:hypothetical protein OHV05_05975 [Kitasatospora sp. NBC_00070]|uniref:hypothetical protein n=1 Tax=Kitasatospora sp. NBC_00070 TaxID=2975962 RepID=UPI0032522D3E